jgi:hypothetical protein
MTRSKLLLDVPNPFGEGIVRSPWEFDPARTPDVETIHANAYGIALRLLTKDLRHAGQSALLVDGPAGSGKTHLISRLARRLREGGPAALPCYFDLTDTPPQMLWSHLRKRVAADLLLRPGPNGQSGLQRLLSHHLPGLFDAAPPPGNRSLLDWLGSLLAPKRRAQICTRLQQELFEKVRLVGEVRITLLKLFSDDAAQARLAQDWLLGEQLSDDELARFGLPASDLADQVREHQSRAVVLSFLRLATDSLPVVVCFDQIEHLMHTLNDRTGYARFGQLVTALRHGLGRGLFVVSFIRSDHVHLLRDAAGEADWARLAENRASLSPLTWAEANQLILQRMNAVEPLRLLRQGKGDEYWPLEKRRLQEAYHKMRFTCTPRDLLWECKKLFGTEGSEQTLESYLLSKWQQRCQQRANAAVGDRLLHALNAVPWLGELLGSGARKVDVADLHEALPDAHLFLQMPEGGRIALSACPRTPHLWRRLDRIARDWKGLPKKLACRRFVVVCDTPEKSLPPGTKDRLINLGKLKSVAVVVPTQAWLCGLEALHSLLIEANKGDLLYEGRAVDAAGFQQWAREGITAPAHELGVLRGLFDEFGLEVPNGPPSGPGAKPPVLAEVG